MLPNQMTPQSPMTPANQETPSKTVRSTLVSRNVTIAGHRTSVRLEPEMWSGLSEICRRERATLHEICTSVAGRKSDNTSLTAAIRVFVMAYYRAAATDEGHIKAGHGYSNGLMAQPTQPTQQQQMQQQQMQQRTLSSSPASSPYMIGSGRLNTSGGGMR